jgi:hypothetical protein
MACKQLPELEVLEEQFAPHKSALPSVNVKLPTLDSYDTFLGVAA